MEIYTIGFTQKSARQFFDILKANGIRRLLDVRLSNSGQLAGFTKATFYGQVSIDGSQTPDQLQCEVATAM